MPSWDRAINRFCKSHFQLACPVEVQFLDMLVGHKGGQSSPSEKEKTQHKPEQKPCVQAFFGLAGATYSPTVSADHLRKASKPVD